MTYLHSVFASCMENYGLGQGEEGEWPNNMISLRAFIDEVSIWGRLGDEPKLPISEEEVALCRRLAEEAKEVVGKPEVDMGSESGDVFQPFWLVVAQGEPIKDHIDEQFVRERFGGTLFPPVSIKIEPLIEAGSWWSDLTDWLNNEEQDEGERSKYLQPWRSMIEWFQTRDEFVQTAFICIGDWLALSQLDRDALPAGTVMTPCTLPRMAVGLTHKGSLCGLFGVSVQT